MKKGVNKWTKFQPHGLGLQLFSQKAGRLFFQPKDVAHTRT
jgi:hypothetical protein